MDPGARLWASGQSFVWRRAALQGQDLCRYRAPRDFAGWVWKERVSRGGAEPWVRGRGLSGGVASKADRSRPPR